MPRSKMDIPKRKAAQTLNHLAGAVIDVNDIYIMFDESIQRMTDAQVDDPAIDNTEAIRRYKEYKERLKKIMMYVVVPREELLKLIAEMWDLDEETIKVYLG